MYKIIDMYLSKQLSMPQIANELNINYNKVRNYLIENNIERRTRSEGIKIRKKSMTNPFKGKKKPPFSEEHKRNISKGKLKLAEKKAKGISLKPNGYLEITRGKNKQRSFHVVVMEKKIGRKIHANECVHHIDENKTNNNINNLKLMTRSEHSRLHALKKCNKGIRRDKLGKFIKLKNKKEENEY